MIEKISTILSQLNTSWTSKAVSRPDHRGTPEAEIRKLLGEPLPKTLDIKDLPRDLQALFGMYGMLEKIKKILEWISRRKGGKLIPAKNTTACVDADDNIYMGVGFLSKHKDEEEIIAGIMAHEWGHMMSVLEPGADLSHLNWDQMHEVRREEESAADAFAGRAMYQMGYKIEQLAKFIEGLDKIDQKVKSNKYYSGKVRAEIIRRAYQAQKEALDQLNKLFGDNSSVANATRSKFIAIA